VLYDAGPGDLYFRLEKRLLRPNGTFRPAFSFAFSVVLYSFGDGLFSTDSLNNVILG
jgi:hypothetical protein